MTLLSVVLGILALSILVTIHEMGHFIAARKLGVDVEAFSIGWGPVLWRTPWLGTEFRVSAFPLGGYCKMRGEKDLQLALESGTAMAPEEGSFYKAAPWKRIIIALAGPLFNLFSALILFFILGLTGYQERALPARLFWETGNVQAAPIGNTSMIPGDTVLEIDGARVYSFEDLQAHVSTSGGRELRITYLRDDGVFHTAVQPVQDQESGNWRIGVGPWYEPIIQSVKEGSPAAQAGLAPGDILKAMDGVSIQSFNQVVTLLEQKRADYSIVVLRDGQPMTLELQPSLDDSGDLILGWQFQLPLIERPGLNAADAAIFSFQKTGWVIRQGIASLLNLFRGFRLDRAVAGPVRTTLAIGQATADGFFETPGFGFANVAQLFSLVGIALFIMNLLPIPALDGGLILISTVEWIKRKPLKPLTMLRFQQAGAFVILALILLAVATDVFFLAGLS